MPALTKKKKRKTLQRNPHVSPGERKKPRTGVSIAGQAKHAVSQSWKIYKASTLRMVGKDKAAQKIEKDWRKSGGGDWKK